MVSELLRLTNPCKPLSPLHVPYIQAGLFLVYFGLLAVCS